MIALERITLAGNYPVLQKRLNEQTEYLEGVLWSDKIHRLDLDSDRDVSSEIDKWGTQTAAFWRGAIEYAGWVGLARTRSYKYPRLTLKGSYRYLRKFIDFLREDLRARGFEGRENWANDPELDFRCTIGNLMLSGVEAREACKMLYPPDQIVGLESVRRVVDEIVVWSPAK